MSNTLKVKLKRSKIGATQRQKATLTGLGLKKVGSTSILKDGSEIKGMIRKVSHLVDVEELPDA